MSNGRVAARFAVALEHEAEAIAHLAARGFPPARIEKDDDGLAVLVFMDVPEAQMPLLAQALPVSLSAKRGIVLGNRPPFAPDL